jgi:predicted nucleic acid-binding protein
VILCDSGPLVALLIPADQHHAACTATLDELGTEILLTTWPCLTEAMYFLGKASGCAAQDHLWRSVARRAIRIIRPQRREWRRTRRLMRRYATTPMDLADSSLVVAAERTGIRRIFTVDRHFRFYLIHDRDPFDVVP